MATPNVTPRIVRNKTSDFVDSNGILHKCALSIDRFTPLKLREKIPTSTPIIWMFRFDLPNSTDHLGLFAGQFIEARAVVEGKELVRSYSPFTKHTSYGVLELLIKVEKKSLEIPGMVRHMYNLKVGETLEFRGPCGGFEYESNKYREIGMLAGGTGIAAMVHIMRSIVLDSSDRTNVSLLYGNYNEEDILFRDELFYYAATRKNVSVKVTLNNPPTRWKEDTGFITESMIRAHLPEPADDIMIVMCGPPPMIAALKTILVKVGYKDSMLFSYF